MNQRLLVILAGGLKQMFVYCLVELFYILYFNEFLMTFVVPYNLLAMTFENTSSDGKNVPHWETTQYLEEKYFIIDLVHKKRFII